MKTFLTILALMTLAAGLMGERPSDDDHDSVRRGVNGLCSSMSANPNVRRPSAAAIGRLAENNPQMLNLLVAFFVFEWRSVTMGRVPHGVDQTGMTCHVPDYITMWTDAHDGILRNGIDVAVSLLLAAPKSRKMDGPGLLSMRPWED